jgi:hypothetical protein
MDLAVKLTKAVDGNRLHRELKALVQLKLLVIDEVGYPRNPRHLCPHCRGVPANPFLDGCPAPIVAGAAAQSGSPYQAAGVAPPLPDRGPMPTDAPEPDRHRPGRRLLRCARCSRAVACPATEVVRFAPVEWPTCRGRAMAPFAPPPPGGAEVGRGG